MHKNETMPHSDDFLYLNVENFLEAKRQLKEMNVDCTDRKLSEVINCNIRTVQKYRSKKNQFPIPLLRLEKLAQYMDVSPDWLCGKTNTLGGVGFSEWANMIENSYKSKRNEPLIKYLENCGIKKHDGVSRYIGLVWDEKHFTEINGVPVSVDQFICYMDELESAIEYITHRFTISLKK